MWNVLCNHSERVITIIQIGGVKIESFGQTMPAEASSILPSSLCIFLPLSVLSSLPACSINGFSCIIWAGVLELMEWGGWHGFQSHSSCPVPFCQFPGLASARRPPFWSFLQLFLSLCSSPAIWTKHTQTHHIYSPGTTGHCGENNQQACLCSSLHTTW